MVKLSSIAKRFTAVKVWILLLICYDCAFWFLIFLRWIGHSEIVMGYSGIVVIDHMLQFISPLLIAALCLWYARRQRSEALLLVGLGALAFTLGQGISSYEELILRLSPFPSIDDVAFIISYPLLFFGILRTPKHQVSPVKQIHVILDVLLMMIVIVTISWYFVLGPTLLLPGQSRLAKVVGTVYPCFDLGLLLCLFILRGSRQVGLGLSLLSIGLVIIMVGDSLFDYLSLHFLYTTGSIIDPLWCLGYQCIGLGIIVQQGASYAFQALPVQILYSRMSFAFLLALGLLVLYMRFIPGDSALRPEVYIGVVLVIGIVLARLVIGSKKLRRLSRRETASI